MSNWEFPLWEVFKTDAVRPRGDRSFDCLFLAMTSETPPDKLLASTWGLDETHQIR
jgi:hypothetical protein